VLNTLGGRTNAIPRQPYPYDCSGLGVFAEMLTDALGLNEGKRQAGK
jgi:hypothetical protein